MSSRNKRFTFLEYCNTNAKEDRYKRLVRVELCPTRFVKYEDLNKFGITTFLVNGGGIEEILNHKKQKSYYPHLIRNFNANIGVGKDVFLPTINGEFMTITPAMIMKIFGVENFGKL